MTESIEHQMTEIYCFVDDYLKAHPHCARWRRSPHSVPRFTDSEVLTIALVQGSLQVATLKQTYRLVANNFHSAFPCLPSYAERLRRLHQLSIHVGLLLEATCSGEQATAFYPVASKPIPLSHQLRHGRVRLMRGDGARFGKTSKGWFFGSKLHALRAISGRFLNLKPGPLSDEERAVVTLHPVYGAQVLSGLTDITETVRARRSYKPPLTKREAAAEIGRWPGAR